MIKSLENKIIIEQEKIQQYEETAKYDEKEQQNFKDNKI